MSYVSPTARATGYTVDATLDWNVLVNDIIALRTVLGVALRSANQSITNNSFTAMSMDTSAVDDASYFNIGSTPTRITFPRTGHYLVEVDVLFAANATGYRAVELHLNGGGSDTAATVPSVGAAYTTVAHVSFLTVSKIAGTYYEVFAYQNSGGALNATARVSVQLVKDNS